MTGTRPGGFFGSRPSVSSSCVSKLRRSRLQRQVDKPVSVRRDRIGKPFGNIEDEALLRVNRALAVWIGLA